MAEVEIIKTNNKKDIEVGDATDTKDLELYDSKVQLYNILDDDEIC